MVGWLVRLVSVGLFKWGFCLSVCLFVCFLPSQVNPYIRSFWNYRTRGSCLVMSAGESKAREACGSCAEGMTRLCVRLFVLGHKHR